MEIEADSEFAAIAETQAPGLDLAALKAGAPAGSEIPPRVPSESGQVPMTTASILGLKPPSNGVAPTRPIVSLSLLTSALSRDVLPLVMMHVSLSVRLRLASVCKEWNAVLRGPNKHLWEDQGIVLGATSPTPQPPRLNGKQASPLPAWTQPMVGRVSIALAVVGAEMPQLLHPFARVRHLHFTGGMHREPQANFRSKVREYAAAFRMLKIETLHLPRSVPSTPARKHQQNAPRLYETDAVATAVFGMLSSAVFASSSSAQGFDEVDRPAILSWVGSLTDLRATLQPTNGHMIHALKTVMMLGGAGRGGAEYAQLRSLDLLLDFTAGPAPNAEGEEPEDSAALFARFLSSDHAPHLTRFALSLWRDPTEHMELATLIQSAALRAVAGVGTLRRLELPAPLLVPPSPATVAGQQESRYDLVASALPLCAGDMQALRALAPTLQVLAVRLPMQVSDSEALWAAVSHLRNLRELHALTPLISCADPNREESTASIRRARLPVQTEAALPARLALKALTQLPFLHTLSLPSAPLANEQEADDARSLLRSLQALETLHIQWSLASQSASLVALKESVTSEDCHLVDSAPGEDLAFLLHSLPSLQTLFLRNYIEAGLSRRATLVGTVASLVHLTAITLEGMGSRELQALLELWAARGGLFDEIEEDDEDANEEQSPSSASDNSFSSSGSSSSCFERSGLQSPLWADSSSSEERKYDSPSPFSPCSTSSSSSGSAFPFSPCAASSRGVSSVPLSMPVPLDWSSPSPLVARARAHFPGRCPASLGPATAGRVPMLEHRHRKLSEQIKCMMEAEEEAKQVHDRTAKRPVPELSTTAAVALMNLSDRFPPLPDRWTPPGKILPPRHGVRLRSFTLVAMSDAAQQVNQGFGLGGNGGGSLLSREDVFLLSTLPCLSVLDLSRHVGCSWKKLPMCRSLRVLKLRDEDCTLMRDENLQVWTAACIGKRDGDTAAAAAASTTVSTGYRDPSAGLRLSSAAFPLLESFEVTCAPERRVFSFMGASRMVRHSYSKALSSAAVVGMLSECMPNLKEASLPVNAMARDTADTLRQLVDSREMQGMTTVELRDSSIEQKLFTAGTIM